MYDVCGVMIHVKLKFYMRKCNTCQQVSFLPSDGIISIILQKHVKVFVANTQTPSWHGAKENFCLIPYKTFWLGAVKNRISPKSFDLALEYARNE